jgi:hypothetical protein
VRTSSGCSVAIGLGAAAAVGMADRIFSSPSCGLFGSPPRHSATTARCAYCKVLVDACGGEGCREVGFSPTYAGRCPSLYPLPDISPGADIAWGPHCRPGHGPRQHNVEALPIRMGKGQIPSGGLSSVHARNPFGPVGQLGPWTTWLCIRTLPSRMELGRPLMMKCLRSFTCVTP